MFITLERLERKGFVSSRYGDPTPGGTRTASTTRLSFQAEGLFSEKDVKFDNVPIDVDSSGSINVRVR